ncbi:MAG: 4-hydroxybutyrate CoA-transferase, partial [Cryomorphaceae bacterium]
MRHKSADTPIITAAEAVKHIHSNQRVFLHSVAMTPHTLIQSLCDRAGELKGVELIHIHTEGAAPYVKAEYSEAFRHNACFVGANVRGAVREGNADYIPVFLSEMPLLFRQGI